MGTLSSIWEVVSNLAVVNVMSAGAALFVNILIPNKPDKDDDDRGDSEESPKPEPTDGDGIDWTEFHRELDEIGRNIDEEKTEVLSIT